jgi:hypothetical protein
MQKLLEPDTDTSKNIYNKFVKSVEMKSGGDTDINIHVVFHPGKDVAVNQTYGNEFADPFEHFFGLYQSTEARLTFMAPMGGVITFADYLTAAMYWVTYRANAYIDRITRERMIADLHATMDGEILKFIPRASEHNISQLDDDLAASAALSAAGYMTIAHKVIAQPGSRSADQMRKDALQGADANYEYILNLRQSDLTAKSVASITARRASRLADIARCDALLAEPTPCASLWKKEILDLESAIAKGIATNWTFDINDPLGDALDDPLGDA